MKDWKGELQTHIDEVEAILKAYFPVSESVYSQRLTEAMAYSYFSGGKRLRPMMMLESYRFFGGTNSLDVQPFMAALEMIHTYSLIHDDLPAMDNDDYRRGRLTNHKQYDEATAILAGDGLLNSAFQIVSQSMLSETESAVLQRKNRAMYTLAEKAGVFGMIGGQMADIEAEKKAEGSKQELLFIHEKKTAALIQAALKIGAILAGAPEEEIITIEKIGYNVGVAFQIQDDILDCIGDAAVLGKPIGSDEKNDKVTYVKLSGLTQAQQDQKELSAEAIKLLDSLSGENEFLRKLILSLVERNK